MYFGVMYLKYAVNDCIKFLYCSPIVAMSLAVVFLNEKPSMMVLLGGVIIVGSLVWMNWGIGVLSNKLCHALLALRE